jgi:hypothetical protein
LKLGWVVVKGKKVVKGRRVVIGRVANKFKVREM